MSKKETKFEMIDEPEVKVGDTPYIYTSANSTDRGWKLVIDNLTYEEHKKLSAIIEPIFYLYKKVLYMESESVEELRKSLNTKQEILDDEMLSDSYLREEE